jgi:GxxExxY protein
MEPQMNADQRRLNSVTEAIIGCAYAVSNEMGTGFLEKVYENALALELRSHGWQVVQQSPIAVHYRGAVVGEYVADLVVAGEVLVELKACKSLDEIHMAQCLNYLKATQFRVCLLINFGRCKIEIKRIVRDF